MYKKMAKTLGLGLAFAGLLFGLFFCMNNDRANSLTTGKEEKEKLTTPKSLGRAFVEVAKKVQPAVVNITTEKTVTMRPWDRYGEDFFKGSPFEDFFKGFGPSPKERGKEYKHKQRSGGSGVIVDKEGYILTNNHVVEDTDKIKIRLNDGREFPATLKGQDPRTDLAVLHIKAKDLPVATLGDSDKLEVGEWAIAIGSPFGLEHTVTVGVISAKGRSGLGTGTYEDFIQTDASINPGNSGGPLINIDGEVVGINAMIIQPGTGIGFAIPINMAKQILSDLIKQGKVVRPWLGISVQDLTPEMAEQFQVKEKEGVLIAQVHQGTGAEKAGLLSGDIIKSVDDKAVKNGNELIKEIQKKKVGQTVKLSLVRDGKSMTVEVTTAAMPAKPEAVQEKETEDKLGARVQELTPQLAARYRISSEIKRGVVVVGVEEGSPAEDVGLQEGDVVLEINRKKIETVKDFEKAAKDMNMEKGVVLRLHRRGNTFYHSFKK
ncbi:MAG TPA: DegQ family serine endoprotease [Thermodesulfobacteriota bacterium]|nr:DegQ family serine endoprotease [Thermodesulfobacteriota bacterium]